MELLLLLVVVEAPNKVGVGVEEGRVVESVLLGLLAMKENAGVEAAEESVALFPKVKEGFGASAAQVSLFSAGFPNGYGGGGCCVEAPGLLKEKPPVEAAAGASSASLLTAPKTKAEGAGAAASFFSSGFPKENVGAAGGLSACKAPNVEAPCGVVVAAKLASPNPPKTEPAVVVAVVDELASVDVVFDEATLSLLS